MLITTISFRGIHTQLREPQEVLQHSRLSRTRFVPSRDIAEIERRKALQPPTDPATGRAVDADTPIAFNWRVEYIAAHRR